MKKSLAFLTLFFAGILLIGFASATLDDVEDKVDSTLESLENVADNPGGVAGDYLEKEWREAFEKNKVGEKILILSDFIKRLNPMFKLIIGVEYSLSWVFFLSLGAWIVLLVMVYFAIKAIFVPNEAINVAGGVIVSFLVARFGLFLKAIEFMSPFLKDKRIIFLFLVGILILLYIYIRLMNSLEKYTKKTMKLIKEEEKEMKEKLTEEFEAAKLKNKLT